PMPIVPPGSPFAPDLQSWIRNDGPDALAPDWERIGTDVTHQGPFNASFSLTGQAIPEPGGLTLAGGTLFGVSVAAWRRRGRPANAGGCDPVGTNVRPGLPRRAAVVFRPADPAVAPAAVQH